MRRGLASLCGLLLLILGGCAGGPPPPGPPSDRPRLILLLVLDQFVWSYLDRYDDLYTGGLRELIDQGVLYTNAYYRHSGTSTGPGHSVIATGRHPTHSGIIDNDWYDRFLGDMVLAVEDPVYAPVGGPGIQASPARLDGFTLGDLLKVESPGSRVVSVSKKPRSAIMLAGRRGDAAFWYDQGRFITTSYYNDELPSWLDRFNRSGRSDTWLGGSWTRASDPAVYETYSVDDFPGERTETDRTFPHMFPTEPAAYYEYLEDTPFIDTLILGVALEALAAYDMGSDDTSDILGIGFSGTDTVGHLYGSESQESLDQVLRLDALLAELFDSVFERVGRENVLIAVSADHGVAPLLERAVAAGETAVRIDEVALRARVEGALSERFPGSSGLIAYMNDETWYLSSAMIGQYGLEQREVEDVIVDTLMSTGEIEVVFRRSDLVAGTGPDHPLRVYFENSLYPSRTADLLALPKKFSYYSSSVDQARHGSAWEYDRHVPIIFMGEGISPARVGRDASPVDIAPTLAEVLGIDFPKEEDAQILVEVIGQPEP